MSRALVLERSGWASWNMALPPQGSLGDISVTAFTAGPLSRPASILGVWLAGWPHPEDPELVIEAWAVSARAAQVLVLREMASRLPLPAWARHVRALDDALAEEVQCVAEAKAAGRAVPGTGLTEWELDEVAPIRSPLADRYAAMLHHYDLEAAENLDTSRVKVGTPSGLILPPAPA